MRFTFSKNMNSILTFLLLSAFIPTLSASELEFQSAYLPLYVEHGVVGEGTEAVHANPRSVSFVSRGSQPETTLSFIMSAYVPHHDTTWNKVGDANLISLSGTTLSHKFVRPEGESPKMEIIIDITAFKLPDTITLKKEEVIRIIRGAVTLNFPHAAITVKDGEQD